MAVKARRWRRSVFSILGLALVVAVIFMPNPIEEQFWALLSPRELTRPPSGAPRAIEPTRRVLLVTLDGLSLPLLEKTQPPTLMDLRRDGRAASVAQAVADSTLESHGAMVSGVTPARSGFETHTYRPWSRFLTPTVFGMCGQKGLRCGLIVGKEKLAAIAIHEPGVGRYECVHGARLVLDTALAYIRSADPDFLMIHLGDTDGVGHRSGWESPEQMSVLREVDKRLGEFLVAAVSAQPRPLSVIVTADHGGWNHRHWAGDPNVDQVPWILWGDGIEPDSIPQVVSALDTAPTIAALLGQPPFPEWQGQARVAIGGGPRH